MPSDEEIIERTIVRAFKKIPKPGPWDIRKMKGTEIYEVPKGEVHEIFVCPENGIELYAIDLDKCGNTANIWARVFSAQWVPSRSAVNVSDYIIHWKSDGAGGFTVSDAGGYLRGGDNAEDFLSYSTDALGWILSGGETIQPTVYTLVGDVWLVRWRRRFDLET